MHYHNKIGENETQYNVFDENRSMLIIGVKYFCILMIDDK